MQLAINIFQQKENSKFPLVTLSLWKAKKSISKAEARS